MHIVYLIRDFFLFGFFQTAYQDKIIFNHTYVCMHVDSSKTEATIESEFNEKYT